MIEQYDSTCGRNFLTFIMIGGGGGSTAKVPREQSNLRFCCFGRLCMGAWWTFFDSMGVNVRVWRINVYINLCCAISDPERDTASGSHCQRFYLT